jgi:hypothetical protein
MSNNVNTRFVVPEHESLIGMMLSNEPQDMKKLLIMLQGCQIHDNDFKKAFDISFKILSNSRQNQGIEVFKKIIKIIRKLRLPSRLKINRFIWTCESFREMVKIFPKSATGHDYVAESIFSMVTNNNQFITDNFDNIRIQDDITLTDCVDSFDPLLQDQSITLYCLKYLEHIFDSNIGYTYDTHILNQLPEQKAAMSSFDYLVLCFNAVLRIIKYKLINPDYHNTAMERQFGVTFWKGVDVVWISGILIQDRINENLIEITDQLKQFNGSPIKNALFYQDLKHNRDKGLKMLARLTSYTKTIDLDMVVQLSYNHLQFLINTRNDRMMTRIILAFSYQNKVYLKKSPVPRIILSLLFGETIPVHVKFDAMRLLISHGLIDEFQKLDNNVAVLKNYIINDTTKLKEVSALHLIDMMVELTGSEIMLDRDVQEFCAYRVPEFSQQYIDILNCFLEKADSIKNNMIHDLGKMIQGSALIIRNLPLLGKNASSYLPGVLGFVETICDTEKYLNHGLHGVLENTGQDGVLENVDQDGVLENAGQDGVLENTGQDGVLENAGQDGVLENASQNMEVMKIFNTLKEQYIDNITPSITHLINALKHENNIIIDRNSEKIMKNLLNIEIDPGIKVIDSIPQDLMDVITYELVANPYFIANKFKTLPDNELQLIDRKTFLLISRSKQHPFTREYVDATSLEEFNNTDEILERRQNIRKKLEALYAGPGP